MPQGEKEEQKDSRGGTVADAGTAPAPQRLTALLR